MQILGIESSSLVAGAAIWRDGTIAAEYMLNDKKTHSQTLLPLLDEMMTMLGSPLEDLDAIAVSAGPGSFTGLRIGSATAKGLGLALNRPLISVSTIEALAFQCYSSRYLICPIMDARRNQVYTGLYESIGEEWRQLMEPCAMELLQLLERLRKEGQEQAMVSGVLFTGDGIPVYEEMIRREASFPVFFAPSFLSHSRPAAVAALGARLFQQGCFETAAAHRPQYLKKTQAERMREEKQLSSLQ